MNVVKKTFQYGDHEVTLETGRIARQASGSVMVTMGSTSVLCTVVAEQKAKAGQAFFPLSVHYIEKTLLSRQNPGWLLQARSATQRKRDIDLATDRSAHSSVVRRRFYE